MNLLEHQRFYLVGIKGVAMTALAQCLADAGKEISGSDVAEDFVTKDQLARLNIQLDTDFDPKHVASADCVIFTAAHGGPGNLQVLAAIDQQIPTYSHAEALGMLFNQKQGIAVCGVGGKSTTSAMITWIMEKTKFQQQTSFAIGVGNIPGLDKTGQWVEDGSYFVAEADEYVTDPKAAEKGKPIQPRFSFLKPHMTVCTNLKFDHPDVYTDFNHTKEVYTTFFSQIENDGYLIVNQDDDELISLVEKQQLASKINIISFGTSSEAGVQLQDFTAEPGSTISTVTYKGAKYQLTLSIPGRFNVMNALAALAVTSQLGVRFEDGCSALTTFKSTMRRSEFIGVKNGVRYYDDYAHHPNEVKQIITSFKEWFPNQQVVIAFQSHTYSRTKQLFDDFVDALQAADQVVMIDIFASARELVDDSISSYILCEAVNKESGTTLAQNLYTLPKLATFLSDLPAETVVITVGAGDIYKVHEMIS